MKRFLNITALMLVLFTTSCSAQGKYSDYFTPDRLRIDLMFAGNSQTQSVYLDGLHFEKDWSGTREHLLPDFDYGEYAIDVYTTDGKKIFSQGFCSLFAEWRTTPEAFKVDKAFSNSLRIPYPKNKVRIVISERIKKSGEMSQLFSCEIDPEDLSINRDKENDFEVVKVLYNGPSENKVDLVFVAEGYTAEEMEKYRLDVEKFTGYLFDIEPYKSRKNDFNVWAVESISVDSGTDIPHQNIWKNTAADSHFYTFFIDRYLTAPDHKKVAQLVSNAPCDAIYVIVNVDKYGGGGIYNYYGLGMSDNKFEAEVLVHEFGHSFAGLGDEYYDSEVAYENMYDMSVEPWEPNLTTMANFSTKWASMVEEGTPLPTPNEETYKGVVGAFEGGGYSAKGIFRPYYDCRMKSNTAEGFCPVCNAAIQRMIDYYCR
jgi:hypothetical protein